MKPLQTILLVLTSIIVPAAQSAENQHTPPTDTQADAWDSTRHTAKDWWQRSRENAQSVWGNTQNTVEQLWTDTRDVADGAWESTRELLGPSNQDTFTQVWDRVLPKLEKTLSLQERHDQLPPSAWIGADQASNREAIDALLTEAVDILATSEAQHHRARIRDLQFEIAETQQAIAEDRQQRVSAPESAMIARTAEDIDRAIEERQADIARYQTALSEARHAFAAELRGMGLDLSDEQVELLLATVVGDNLIDLGIVFDNVKAITAQLESLVRESGEDLRSARRYYGMYVVLLKSLDQMHLQIEQAIAERYVPQIDAIIARAKALTAETRALQEHSPEKAALLAANLSAQHLTLQAADVYRDYLIDQGQQVAAARRELGQDIAAAWNTYETVRVSGELLGLVRSSRTLLDGLLDRQVPVLRPFRNLEMKREFEKLTAQLRRVQSP